MVAGKYDLEAKLHAERTEISSGRLKEDNPLDLSENFRRLCEACRRGDLKVCQEMITEGANINARDLYDYTPLILASLCGHFEVVQLLLESGALCERDTFQGERCLYNALNDRIRNLLLEYDYSKSTDPLQPLAGHITSLLTRKRPRTSDITLHGAGEDFHLHKFILSARSSYFNKKLSTNPETTSWKLANTVAPQAFELVIRYLYLGEPTNDLSQFNEDEEIILDNIYKLSQQLEFSGLWEGVTESRDRRIARQRRSEEVNKGRDQLQRWFEGNILRHKIITDVRNANNIKWVRENAIFADVLLRADEDADEDIWGDEETIDAHSKSRDGLLSGIPIGPTATASRSPSRNGKPRKSVLFPAHRAMLLRSEFFLTMFSSSFREAQETEHLQIIPIDCNPAVLEVVLNFLYAEKAEFPLHMAVDVLFAADLLLIEKLKNKAATVISTLGNGAMITVQSKDREASRPAPEDEELDIYDVIRAGWLTRVHRLEEFAARYIAYRLENYIDTEEFADLIRESAARIKERQETDSIELLDDIRYYLSERFRLRFEDAGLEEMMEEAEVHLDSLIEDVTSTKDVSPTDEGVDVSTPHEPVVSQQSGNTDTAPGDLGPHMLGGAVRTLDGEVAGDEFASDAINYQLLLGKIDALLDELKLDA